MDNEGTSFPKELQRGDLKYMSWDICYDLTMTLYESPIIDHNLCTYATPESAICSGDSGSPLIKDNPTVQIGMFPPVYILLSLSLSTFWLFFVFLAIVLFLSLREFLIPFQFLSPTHAK